MDKELKKIKKLYGEVMMHYCRDNFALILDTPDLILNILTSNFHPTHELYNDLEENNLLLKFKEYIFTKINKEEEKVVEVTETPEELMAQAGYNLYECLTEEDIQKFKKYYAKGEELCTFRTHRLRTSRVFFAVKKNVDEIKREDFPNPSRQDEYGTSVISIQFTKDGTNTLSIKNRYNHTVDNPDATFSNNLDNIIPGLTDSFEEYYGLKQQFTTKGFEIPGYILANDGKYYKYNYEMDNIYYCPNNIIIDNFEVKKYPKEKYLVLDYFILDLEQRKIYFYKPVINDFFLKSLGQIEKIEIRNEKEEKKVLITPAEGEVIEISLDKLNRIISYKNNNIKEINYAFLNLNKCLRQIEMNNVVKIDDLFLHDNRALSDLNLPKLEVVGHDFMYHNLALRKLNLPNVKMVGHSFLERNCKLNLLYMPNLEKVGNSFLGFNNALKRISLPNLTDVLDDFLVNNYYGLEEVYLPKLENVRDYFLAYNKSLKSLILPSLKHVGHSFLENNVSLNILSLPNLEIVGKFFLSYNKDLRELNLPSLKSLSHYFLDHNSNLEKVHLLNLETIGSYFLGDCSESLKIFIAPKLKETWEIKRFTFRKIYSNLEEFIIADNNLSLQRKLD